MLLIMRNNLTSYRYFDALLELRAPQGNLISLVT
jgi:hypothetical protein